MITRCRRYNFAKKRPDLICVVSGYGNLVPRSIGARIFCCLYAIFGIPLCLVALVAFGDFLGVATGWLERRFRCGGSTTVARGQRYEHCARLGRSVVLASLGLLVFILLPSVVFKTFQDWDYSTALYFSVVSLSTVGFGDYVAGDSAARNIAINTP